MFKMNYKISLVIILFTGLIVIQGKRKCDPGMCNAVFCVIADKTECETRNMVFIWMECQPERRHLI